jgi:hypothetical protein
MTWPAFSNLKSRVRTVLNESTAGFWTDAEIARLLNDGERDIAIKTCCLQNVDSLTTALYASMYRKVQFSGHKVLYMEYVDATTPKGMQKIRPQQMGHLPFSGSAPQYWFQWGQYIIVDPLPAASYTMNAYIADYPQYEMYADADVPQVPYEFQEDIVNYAVYMAMMKDRKWGQAAAVYQSYIGSLQVKRMKYVTIYPESRQEKIVPETIEYREGKGE